MQRTNQTEGEFEQELSFYKGSEFHFATRIFICLFGFFFLMGQKSVQLNPFYPSLSLPKLISVHPLLRFKYLLKLLY